MNIINYKPKMELLFILHDFMLPPSFLIQPHLPQLSFSKSWAGMDWKGSGTRHCCGSEAALVFWSSATGLLGGGNVAAPRWNVLGKVLWFISLEYHLGKLWRSIYTCSAKIKEEDCGYKHVSTLELKHDREYMKLTYQLQGCLEKSLKWLLINYQILLPNFLVFSCEWLGEFDIASKVT